MLKSQSPAPETKICSGTVADQPRSLTIDQFVAEVIYDGRFLSDFTTNPELVAKLLGVTVPPEILEQIRGRKPSVVLAEVTEVMTRQCGERLAQMPAAERPPEPVAGIIIIGVIVIICVLAPEKPAYRVPRPSTASKTDAEDVVDNSAEASCKL